jgi:antitoxin HigA-1
LSNLSGNMDGKMNNDQIPPVHPGIYLKELLDELDVSQHQLIQDLGVSDVQIGYIINGKRPITAEFALQLGRYFGQTPHYWTNLQSRYDTDIAEDALSEKVEREVSPLSIDRMPCIVGSI